MLTLTSATKIYLVAGATDMRKQRDGLIAIVSGSLNGDPLAGDIYVFCNGRRNIVRILFWDSSGSGFWVCTKRLERGTFSWPDGTKPTHEMDAEELAVLLAGVDLIGARRRRWYER